MTTTATTPTAPAITTATPVAPPATSTSTTSTPGAAATSSATSTATATPGATSIGEAEVAGNLGTAELLFSLSCYCYIVASEFGHKALSVLDPQLIRVQPLDSIDLAVAEQAEQLAKLQTEMEKDLTPEQKAAIDLANDDEEPVETPI